MQIINFIKSVDGSNSLYGLRPETLDSLILDILPPLDQEYVKVDGEDLRNTSQPPTTYLLQELLVALCSNAGFCIPKVSKYI